MTPNEIRRRFPNATESFIKANAEDCADSRLPGAKPERTVRHEPLATHQGKEGNVGRVVVRITSFRRRLLDPDNLTPKYFIDGLRRSGLIADDSAEDIILQVSQEKVQSKLDEHTRIEIEPVTQASTTTGLTQRQILLEQLWSQCSHSWNRQAFDAFMETLSEDDLREYISVGTT